MHAMRKFGNMIQKRVTERQFSDEEFAKLLHLDLDEVRMLYKGRLYLSLEQLDILTELLGDDMDVLMDGDDDYYNQNVVHCMTEFTNVKNREMILDFIEAYLDVYEAANAN